MITVIADDLTGAAEIAGVCLRYGLKVSFGINSLSKTKTEIQIIATDSRSMNEEEAYHIHRDLIEQVMSKNPDCFIFKKCDSALRGHILAELTALAEITGNKKVLIQPANPKAERYILNGTYIINDQLIENTGFAHDPDFPALSSLVKLLILSRSQQYAFTNDVFTGDILETVQNGIYLPDCSTVNDLGKSMKLYTKEMLLCGSAAFFEEFLKFQNCQLVPAKPYKPATNFLLVSGSTHPESKIFRKSLLEKNCPTLLWPDALLTAEISQKDLNEFIQKAIKIYKINSRLNLSISDKNIQFPESSTILKQRMGIIVKELLLHCPINELYIEGGATAFEILQVLHLNSLKPLSELSPGVVKLHSEGNNPVTITIKPGSYRWPEKLFN